MNARQPTPRGLVRHGSAWVADDATIVADVRLGEDVSIWYGTVVRGDVASITIGDRTNIQDNSVVHPQHDEDVVIGEDVVCGHGVMLHGRTVGDRCLIGMGSILLPGVVLGDDSLVAAGALLPLGFEVPAGHVAMGAPAKVVRELRPSEREMIEDTKRRYVALARRHEGGYA